TTWYKRLARVDCMTDWTGAAESNVLEMTVYTTFAAGAIATTGEDICFNGDPALIGSTTVASGGDESITYQWQSSLDAGFSSPTNITSNTATYDPPTGLTVTTWYRRQAQDGTCNTTFTTSTGVWKVTVYNNFTPGAIASTGETVCYNGDPALIGNTTVASGGDESITYQWQYSTDNFSTVTSTISSSDATTYNPPSGLTATTWYRRQAKDATCNTTFTSSSGVWQVIVHPEFISGEISAAGETICYNTSPTTAIGSTTPAGGGDNTITYSWRSSADSYAVAIDGATSSTYTPAGPLTSSTSYRRYAKDNTCNTTPEVSTGTWTVTVNDNFTAGEIETTGENICNSTVDPGIIGSIEDASGGNESITYQWQSSLDAGFSSPTNITSNTATYDPPSGLTQTTWYRRQAVDGTCNTTYETSTGVWEITVYPEFVVGSISDDQAFCQSGIPDELTGVAPTGGNTPYTYQWQNSLDGTSFSDITGAESINYQPGELTDTTYYQLLQTSASGCGTLATNMVTITVHNLCCSSEANYCQEPDPTNPTGRISDIANSTKIYDNFWGIVGGVTGIEWWGVMGDGTTLCSEDPKDFEIIVYTDNAGTVGDVFATYNISVSGTPTGATYGTANVPILRFEAILPNPVPRMSTGWVSIQGNPSGTCEFTWLNSPNGDNKSFMDGRSQQLTEDFAFSLTADPNIPLSDWAVYIGIFLIGGFVVLRFRKRLVA
ncbi:MAG: hypothetical protein HQ521_11565, partial [Bacteroidetes bacterium]|nr:hypothetical protein [Bacteroidota bacterium]